MNYYVSARRNIWRLFVNMFEAHEVYVGTYEGHSWMYRQKRKDFEEMYNVAIGGQDILWKEVRKKS